MRRLAVVRDYDGLHEALRRRVIELDVAMASVDDPAGLPDRYVNKLLSPSQIKGIGRISLGPLLGALGLALVVVEDKDAMVRVRRLPRRGAGGPRIAARAAMPGET